MKDTHRSPAPYGTGRSKDGTLATVLIVGGLFAVLLMLAVPYINKYTTIGPVRNEAVVQVADLLRNPNSFMGENVQVAGVVNDNVNSNAMVVDQTPDLVGDEVLIVSNTALEPIGGGPGEQPLFGEGKNVVVSGEVGRFDRQMVEERLGITLDPATFDKWTGKPFIVAQNVIEQ